MTSAAAEASLPVPIRSYIGRYVALRRRHALLRAAGLAVSFTIGWAVVCCVTDRAWPLPQGLRLVLLCVNAVVVIALVVRPLRRWIRSGLDWRAAAADIERRDARFAQRLQTVTSQLLTPPQQRASAQLVACLTGELNAELADDHPGRLLPKRPVVRPWLGAAALLMFGAGLWLIPGFGLPTLLVRYAAPFASVAPPTTTQLTVEPRGIDLIEGQTVSIEALAERAGPGQATLHYTKPGQPWAEFPMRPARAGRFDAVLGPVDSDIRYYVTAGDARSDTYLARVVKRPTVREFRIDYLYPAYLNRPPVRAVNADGFIEAPVGTEATVTVIASEPLTSASLALGDRTLALTPADRPEAFGGSFMITNSATYTLEMISTSNVAGAGEGTMRVSAIPDVKPAARLLRPASALRLRPRDTVTLHFAAEDDYGVAAVTVRATRAPGHVDFSGGQPNLALGRPTTQSTTVLEAAADRAVDGNIDGNFHAGSVTHTDMQPNSWWQVDLGELRAVSRVQIWNRTDAVSERLSDVVAFVSESPMASEDPAALRKLEGVGAFDLPGPVGSLKAIDAFRPARFVRVQLQRPEYLSLAEVRVLGMNPSPPAAATTAEAAVALDGDPRWRQGRMDVSLATLGAQLGDVVALSIAATDTAGQTVVTEPLHIQIMPHAADPNAIRRADELDRASAHATVIAESLEQALAGATTKPTTAPAASAGRGIVRAGEQAAALQVMLFNVLADGLRGRRADAVAAAIDTGAMTTAVANDVYRGLGIDGIPAAAELKRLGDVREATRNVAKRLGTLADGERASAVLADVQNLAALDAAIPSSLQQTAALSAGREAMRSEVAGRLKAIGLDVATPDVISQLSERLQAADDPVPPLDFGSMPGALMPRLAAAARVESARVDVDPVRARDLQRAADAGGMSASLLAPLVATLDEEHAVRRARQSGGIVLLRGLWIEAAARSARARLPDGGDPQVKNPELSRLKRTRTEQVTLFRLASARPGDVAHLAAQQEEVAASIERLIRAQHALVWSGRPPTDTRLQAIVTVGEALRRANTDLSAADELARSLRPFQPETSAALRAIEEALRPALFSKDAKKVEAATGTVRAALQRALDEIVAPDPLLGAYAGAHSAALALRADPINLDAAIAAQRGAVAGLRRAIDAALRQAARIRAETTPIAVTSGNAPAGAQQRAIATPQPSSRPTTAPALDGYDKPLRAYFEAIKR